MDQAKKVFAVAITGGSGSAYGLRLLNALVTAGHEIHAMVSPAAEKVMKLEAGLALGTTLREREAALRRAIEADDKPGTLRLFDRDNFAAPAASGSFPLAGMAIAPCSVGTLGRLAAGTSSNLIERAADVCLKERRPLVLVPRETPLNDIHLRNMLTLRQAGADILPAMPSFYHKPKTIADLVDTVVARILDKLGVANNISPRWGIGLTGDDTSDD